MEKLDNLVAEYIEHRLLEPKRLEQLLSHVLDRRTERAERRKSRIAELRKRAAETSEGGGRGPKSARPIRPSDGPCKFCKFEETIPNVKYVTPVKVA
jgi:hypothetical protein